MKRWTDEEVSKLKELFSGNSINLLCEKFNRKKGSIKAKAKELNLRKNQKWTDEEKKYLLDNYSKSSVKACAIKLNKNEKQIEFMAWKLKLYIRPLYKQIQELKEKIYDLEQENAILKGENKALKDIVDRHSNIEKRRLESIANYNRMYGK